MRVVRRQRSRRVWGWNRKTVRKYTAPAIAAGLAPGGAALGEAEWVELVRGWFPELVDARLRQSSWPAIEVLHDNDQGPVAGGDGLHDPPAATR